MVNRNQKNGNEGYKRPDKANAQVKVIPKNVRQVGEATGKQKIYIEDYVVTYLNQLAHPTNSIARGAMLLGHWDHYKDGTNILYICGAVEADNLSFDMQEIQFTNEDWTIIYEKVNQYFEEVNVVGWFLSRLGYGSKISDSMIKLQKKYFKEKNSVLYLMDALEQEDAFYVNEEEGIKQLKGYYIYYERNTPMQNYLVENHAMVRPTRDSVRVEAKDEQLLHSYHEIMAGRKGNENSKRVTSLLYVVSAVLTILFLAFGITLFNNYDKLQSMQSALDKMTNSEMVGADSVHKSNNQEAVLTLSSGNVSASKDALQRETTTQDAESQNTIEQNAETENETTTEDVKSEDGQVQAKNVMPAETTKQPATTQAIAVSATTSNYYTVQAGDTLVSISNKVYQSPAYVDAIRKANEINDGDYIFPGQKIVIPSIQ